MSQKHDCSYCGRHHSTFLEDIGFVVVLMLFFGVGAFAAYGVYTVLTL